MKGFSKNSLLSIIVALAFLPNLSAQNSNEFKSVKSNAIGLYVGIVDINFHYERSIIQKSNSSSKLRIGTGYAAFLNSGEGNYLNAAFVQLFGARNSHVELNAGVKYMLTNSIQEPSFSEQFIPDIFAGYRFEKPTGGLIFRAGLNYPTLINVGVGYKF